MTFDFVQIFIIVVLAVLFYWANEKVNTVPVLKPVISVAIVVVSVLALLASVFGKIGTHITIR